MLPTACFDGPRDDKGNRGCIGTDFFPSGQRYTGQYLLENQHGRGIYLHPSGFKYMGYVYAGDAEFCGRALSPTGAEYQGMFSDGQPHGAGQMTYRGGACDAGLWCRGRLLRLFCHSPTAVRFDHLLSGHYIGWYDRRVLHVQEPESRLEAVLRQLEGGRPAADCSLSQLDQMTNLKLRDRRAAGFPSHRYSCGADRVSATRLLAWSDTKDVCDLQTHTYLTEKAGRLDAELVSVSVPELLRPGRTAELPAGRLQRASLLLLHASALDRSDVVRLLLRAVRISPNVMDAAGVTALICAAMRGHTATVNTLLDHGADINHVTDDGLTALSCCMALHHPDYSTRHHLDQLRVFTHLQINDELAGAVEWHGGEAEQYERSPRPFPARPVPLSARRQKAVRRPRPRYSPSKDSAVADIRQALVPGPGAGLPAQPPTGSSRRRRAGAPARDHAPSPPPPPPPHPTSPPSPSHLEAGAPPPPSSHVETSQRPRTPTAEAAGPEEAPQQPVSPAESAQSLSASEPAAPLARSRRPSAERRSGCSSPPAWPSGWPEAPDLTGRSAADSLLSARTDDGTDGSWWERLPAGRLHCCPSLERALAAAAAGARDESNQETAVRLIEAFCSGPDGKVPPTEYSTPCPGSVDQLAMIKLLLRRGASPEASKVPFPAVHHALLADDRPLLSALLTAGGDPNSRLSHQLGGLAPLHVSCSLPGEDSLQLTALLLKRGADPSVSCDPGAALLDAELLQRRQLPQPQQLGARAPLHVACQRAADSYDRKVISRRLMNLLEEAGADVEALCNGHSPITLALLAGDMTLAVDLMSRGADPLRQLGPPHYDALGLAVSPAVELAFQLDERKQMVRTLLAYGCDALNDYPLEEEGNTGNILQFAQWINRADDTLLTAPPHQLKGAQRGQKKQREAFLAFLAELVADELQRHQHMAPLVEQGLFEEAELTTAEYRCATGTGTDQEPPTAAQDSEAASRAHRKRKRKIVVLSAECFCPLCDRVLGKCFKGCPNYGRRTPKLMSAELQMDNFAEDLLNLDSDEDDGKAGKKGKRRKRKAEAKDDDLEALVELGSLLGPDGKPLKCHACHKGIKRRKVPCSACKQVMYCSKKCRTTDWDKSHGYSCPARSQVSLSRLQDSDATGSSQTRRSSADSSRRQRGDSQAAGRRGRRAPGRAGSLDAGGKRGRRAAGRSLDARRHGHPGMTPIAGRMPPWLAAFMAQFEGMHLGECRHLVQGEWYEDNCKMKENYSYI